MTTCDRVEAYLHDTCNQQYVEFMIDFTLGRFSAPPSGLYFIESLYGFTVGLSAKEQRAILELYKVQTHEFSLLKNVVFLDMKAHFVPHRRHITSPLQIPAS
jgi:hypothetical protein